MAVADPAPPSALAGSKALAAQASDVLASAASTAVTRTMGMPGPSPLRADAGRVHAFGEGRVGRLVGPRQIVPLVLVGEVGGVHVQFGIPADLVCDGGVEVLLRRLVLFEAGDAALVLQHCALRTVVVRHA